MLGVLSQHFTNCLIFTILMALSRVPKWGARAPGKALDGSFIDCQERYDNPNFTSWLLLISIDIRCFPKFKYLLVICSLDNFYLYKYCLSEGRYFSISRWIYIRNNWFLCFRQINKHFLCIANWCWRRNICIQFINIRKMY